MANEAYQALQTEMVYIPREQLTFSIFGKTFALPRDKGLHSDIDKDGSYPLYRYCAKDYPPALPWTLILKTLRDYIHKKTGHFCNHVVINRYRNGDDHIGYYHDKTGDFVDGAAVCTISFGETRTL